MLQGANQIECVLSEPRSGNSIARIALINPCWSSQLALHDQSHIQSLKAPVDVLDQHLHL